MKSVETSIHETERKLQYYGKEVANLLNKKEYSNFLNVYIKLLYENLIKYQTLNQVKLENETLYAKKDNEENKENET